MAATRTGATAALSRPRPCGGRCAPARDVALGNVGAGLGAVAGALKGGLGTASAVDATTGITVAALVAVNPVGSVTMPGSRTMWAWHLEQAGELGGQTRAAGRHRPRLRDQARHRHEHHHRRGRDRRRPRPRRPAAPGRDGAGRLRLRHPPDPHALSTATRVFALATGAVPLPDKPDALVRLGTIAADVVARAVMRGVYEAEGWAR